jgi:dihydrofolate synthase / folylpolyglutamate synthase
MSTPSREASLDWLAGLEHFGIKLGLESITTILEARGRPERAYRTVHIAGTNGKGSVAAMVERGLRAAGLRTGRYTSPHLDRIEERVALDGTPVDPATFEAVTGHVLDVVDQARATGTLAVSPTFFEVSTAVAFEIFRRHAVDVAIVEVGLGGRYDATNVFAGRAVVVLTSIALEHTDLLGETEREVAAEKLAVARPGGAALVIGRSAPGAVEAVASVIEREGLRGLEIDVDYGHRERPDGTLELWTPRARHAGVRLAVLGGFQRDNCAAAVAGAEELVGAALPSEALARALGALTLPGRLEALEGRPELILDGAHNPAGVSALLEALGLARPGARPVFVVSVLDDKDLERMIALLGAAASAIVATRSSHARAVDPRRIAEAAERAGVRAQAHERPTRALEAARAAAGPDGTVLVCGSLYLLADLRPGLVTGPEPGLGMLPPVQVAVRDRGRVRPEVPGER